MIPLKKYIADLLQRIGYIESFTVEGHDAFIQDLKTQEAVIRSYEVIGEIVKRLPESLLSQYPHIQWKDIKAFRDFLIHNYGEIDLIFVWKAVRDLPNLKAAVEAMHQSLIDDDQTSDSPEL